MLHNKFIYRLEMNYLRI